MIGAAHVFYDWHGYAATATAGSATVTLPILPSDMAGRFLGGFQLKLFGAPFGNAFSDAGTRRLNNSNTNGWRIVVDFMVNGLVVATFQHWNKRYWIPFQLVRYGSIPPATYFYNSTESAGATTGVQTVPANATIMGNFTLPGSPYQINAEPDPYRSYQDAYFYPTNFPTPASAFDFTRSTTARPYNDALATHPEPFVFMFDRFADQVMQLRVRAFAEIPNPSISSPIHDDPPPADFGVRDCEQVVNAFTFYLDAWALRIGGMAEEVVADFPPSPDSEGTGTDTETQFGAVGFGLRPPVDGVDGIGSGSGSMAFGGSGDGIEPQLTDGIGAGQAVIGLVAVSVGSKPATTPVGSGSGSVELDAVGDGLTVEPDREGFGMAAVELGAVGVGYKQPIANPHAPIELDAIIVGVRPNDGAVGVGEVELNAFAVGNKPSVGGGEGET